MPFPFECMRPMAAGFLGPARRQEAAGEQRGIADSRVKPFQASRQTSGACWSRAVVGAHLPSRWASHTRKEAGVQLDAGKAPKTLRPPGNTLGEG